jgi:hypothetical protein
MARVLGNLGIARGSGLYGLAGSADLCPLSGSCVWANWDLVSQPAPSVALPKARYWIAIPPQTKLGAIEPPEVRESRCALSRFGKSVTERAARPVLSLV